MTAKEKIFGSVLGAIWLSGFAAVWQVAAPQFSDDNKARIFLVYLAIGIVLLLWWIREARGRRMGLLEFLLWGGGLGLIAGLIVYGMFAMAEKAPQATAVASDPVGDSNTAADEFDFYFHSFFFGGGKTDVQYGEVTATNRSPRKMHLQLWGCIYYWKDNGEPASLQMQADWTPETAVVLSASGKAGRLKENTGEDFIDFNEWETKKGRVVLNLPQPDGYGMKAWNIDPCRDVYFHGFDSVTGKHVAFKASPGYPDAKMPWPLPSPAKALALAFPEPATAPDLPPLESLDLVARTRMFGYRNDNSVSLSAVIENRSINRMKIQINLLSRKSVDDKEWRTFRAVIEPHRKEDRGALDYYALDFGPDDVADCSLVFAGTGFTNKEGNELKENPSLNLLEIFDEVSRKKVWCAVDPGYPPGTDMRWANIKPPPAIPKSDSDNTQKDASNDSK